MSVLVPDQESRRVLAVAGGELGYVLLKLQSGQGWSWGQVFTGPDAMASAAAAAAKERDRAERMMRATILSNARLGLGKPTIKPQHFLVVPLVVFAARPPELDADYEPDEATEKDATMLELLQSDPESAAAMRNVHPLPSPVEPVAEPVAELPPKE